MEERFITVQRTARYHVLGDIATAKEIWFALHGYGHLARFFLNDFEGLVEERAIVAPEGLSRFYLDSSYARVGASWMTREDRDHEIEDQTAYLDALARQVTDACAALRSFHVLGFSQGVATAARWALLGSRKIDHLVFWGGGLPHEFEPGPLGERWDGVRIDLVHGEKDGDVPEEVFQRNQAQLRTARLEHTCHRFEGGHELDRVILERLMTG